MQLILLHNDLSFLLFQRHNGMNSIKAQEIGFEVSF
jgi:hypothetical protein